MRNFNANEQVRDLGLAEILAGRERYRVLDFGCGREEYLPEFLEERGFAVDGIDPEIKFVGKNRIGTEVKDCWPKPGCIPVTNPTYDLVLAHQNNCFNETMSGLRNTQFLKCMMKGGYEQQIGKREMTAKNILTELSRVCKPTGAIVIQPGLDLIEVVFGEELKRLDLNTQKIFVPEIPKEDGEIFCEGCYPHCYEYVECIRFKTVLYKPQVDPSLLKKLVGKI